MKSIRLDKFKDYTFHFPYVSGHGPLGLIENLDFLYPKPLYLILLVLLLIFGLFDKKYLIFFISFLVVYIYHHFALKQLQHGLKFRRNFPPFSKENNKEVCKYQITNLKNYELGSALLLDQFSGQTLPKVNSMYLRYFPHIKKKSQTRIDRNLTLNNGMGKKSFGPIAMFFSDQIGLHRLQYHDDVKEDMLVYPFVYKTKGPILAASDYSYQYGVFDSISRGNNVNFYSTREYVPGDSIKRINWKLSLKTQQVIVNEFERNTNAQITMVLNNDNRLHAGTGRESTFEYCKDLILSLCSEHINNHNHFGLISQSLNIPLNAGKTHLNKFEIALANLELSSFNSTALYHKNAKVPQEVIEFKNTLFKTLNYDNYVYVFSSIIPGKVWDNYFDVFKSIPKKSKNLHLVLVDGLGRLEKNSGDDDLVWLKQLNSQLPAEIARITDECKKLGIDISIIKTASSYQYKEVIKHAFR